MRPLWFFHLYICVCVVCMYIYMYICVCIEIWSLQLANHTETVNILLLQRWNIFVIAIFFNFDICWSVGTFMVPLLIYMFWALQWMLKNDHLFSLGSVPNRTKRQLFSNSCRKVLSTEIKFSRPYFPFKKLLGEL